MAEIVPNTPWDSRLGPEPRPEVHALVDEYTLGLTPVSSHLPRPMEAHLGNYVADPDIMRDVPISAALKLGAYVTKLYLEKHFDDVGASRIVSWQRFLRLCRGEVSTDIATSDGISTSQVNRARQVVLAAFLELENIQGAREYLSSVIAQFERPDEPNEPRPDIPSRKIRLGLTEPNDYVNVDPDELRWYLRSAAQIPRLNAVEELETASAIREGVEAEATLAAIARHERGADAITIELLEAAVRRGKQMEELFIAANRRLVAMVVRAFPNHRHVDIYELLKAGEEGVRRVARKFSADAEGYTSNLFSAYGMKAIRGAVQRYYDKHSLPFEVSYGFGTFISAVEIARYNITATSREPTPEELTAYLNTKNPRNKHGTARKYTVENVTEAMAILDSLSQTTYSSARPHSRDYGHNTIDDLAAPPYLPSGEYNLLRLRDSPYLAGLTDLEYTVFVLNNGLITGGKMLVGDIAGALRTEGVAHRVFDASDSDVRMALVGARKKVAANLLQQGIDKDTVQTFLGERPINALEKEADSNEQKRKKRRKR